MLSDTERKVFQIIRNRYRYNWHRPDPEWVAEKAIRDLGPVKMAMRKLLDNGYLETKEGLIRVAKGYA